MQCGRIGLHNDSVNDVTWRYEYAMDGSLTSAYADNGERFDYTYEPSTGKLLTATVSDGTTSKTTTYNYSDHTNGENANLIESVVLPTGTVEYSYDGFYRASYDVNVNSTDILTTDYTFVAGEEDGSTTTLVESMTNAGDGWSDTLSYTYDKKGNIETISENGTQKVKYYYDALNQLIREDNAWLNKTIVYTYDMGGNILSVSEYAYTTASDISSLTPTASNTYAYGDSNWKDKLTAYNGNTITYDSIGNPLTYYDGKTFTWQNGRQLASVSGTGRDFSYTYNADGIRTSKTINGVTTRYLLEGSNIVMQTNGTDTMWFHYDATGSLTGFELNGTPYFYVKNLQGDIIAITGASGNVVVEYVYDSWGKLISTTGSLASTVGVKNPFRYRGYYYDTELGLYYLNSRYYDPSTKRFINADGYLSTGQGLTGNNMFTYCKNSPVLYVDHKGESPTWAMLLVGFSIGVYIGSLVSPTTSEIKNSAEKHYSRNQKNKVDLPIETIITTYTKVEEWADQYHENTDGRQGDDAIYNDKYLSPNGGHYEVIICSPPDKEPYIVDEFVDETNMGTYNYASNDAPKLIYYVDHFFRDMIPYYLYGNTADDEDGILKWALD